MQGLRTWLLKVTKRGNVAVVDEDERVYIIEPDGLHIDTQGFSFQYNNKEFDCRLCDCNVWGMVTPMSYYEKIKSASETKASAAYFIYEVITGLVIQNDPLITNKKPFNLEVLKKKYEKYLGKYEDVDFESFVSNIPD